MDKSKRVNSEIGLRERLLQAKVFDYTVFAMPREFTGHMTGIVRYPELINDIGRTVDVRRAENNRFTFEIRQKRYLGRGTFAISAKAKGAIVYDESDQKTRISGLVQLGGQYVILLIIMMLFVLVSAGIMFVTILYIPLFLLMVGVLGLHWMYLLVDRHDLQEQLALLVEMTEREKHLKDSDGIEKKQTDELIADKLTSQQ